MNCETGFWHSFGVWSVAVCRSVEGSEGSSPLGAHLRAAHLYAVGSFSPDHDAVMRIGGEAPGGGPILSVGIKCQVRIRHPATSDLNSAVGLKASASAENSGECYARSGRAPFRTLDVRRRPPVVRQS